MERVKINNNVNLYIDKTNKFKSVNIDVVFSTLLSDKDKVYYYALSAFLEDSCAKYDTKQKVSNVLDELYGAKLNVKIDKKGEALLIRFTSSLINDKYVKQDLLSKQFALLNEFINHPIFEDDIKARKLFNEVKEILVLNINTINDDPISYASNKANELFGDMLANKAIYSQEDVNKLSFEHLKQIYDQMIKKMAVDIFVLGDVDKEESKKLALQYFNYPSRDTTKSLVHLSHREDHLYLVEDKKLKQANIVLLYECGIGSYDDDYAAMIIANGMLGVLPTSLLFSVIREKYSYCYSIYSSYKIYDGIIKIATSCNKENIEKIKELINEQIDIIRNNKFDDNLLNDTKNMYISNYRLADDSISNIMWSNYRESVVNDQRTTDKIIEDFMKVTREDVARVMNKLVLKVDFELI